MAPRVFAAVDLGASGGRVMAGLFDAEGDTVELRTIHRFPNGVIERGAHLRWDIGRLFRETLVGLGRLADEYPQVESIGIDTWGVDYGLLDRDGDLMADPVAYRDDRTLKVIDDVHALIPRQELFAVNGLQFLPFNTIYQLAAEKQGSSWRRVAHVVLLPDLIAFWLTGALGCERTNASTTGLLDARTGEWSAVLFDRLGIPSGLIPPLESPGAIRGRVRPEYRQLLGLPDDVVVTTVGSHDTASAVAGIPAITDNYAYVSSGTWSLAGLLVDRPVLSGDAFGGNFTNERGIDGRTRFLRNVGGLWLLQESIRAWAEQGQPHDLAELLVAAAALPPGGPIIDVDEVSSSPARQPVGMPQRIAAAARGTCSPGGTGSPGLTGLLTPEQTVRCVIDSLAIAYSETLRNAAGWAGVSIDTIHMVGGGSQNELLCHLTACAAGLPVVAGPAEATALGNTLVQARAHGAAPESPAEARALLARCLPLRRYDPAPA